MVKYFKSSEDHKTIALEKNVFSIHKNCDGGIVFTEECDSYFSEEFTKEQAIELLEEAIAWIKEQ